MRDVDHGNPLDWTRQRKNQDVHRARAQNLVVPGRPGQFVLRLRDGAQLRVEPANVEVVAVHVGSVVWVAGLVGAAKHNGKRGKVVGGPHPETGRYRYRKMRLNGGDDGA